MIICNILSSASVIHKYFPYLTKSPKIKEIFVLEIRSKQEKSDEKVIDSIKYLQD